MEDCSEAEAERTLGVRRSGMSSDARENHTTPAAITSFPAFPGNPSQATSTRPAC